ncbi:MAG: hypothetical protein ACYC6C_00255 [Coriobacteriia bacterium]
MLVGRFVVFFCCDLDLVVELSNLRLYLARLGLLVAYRGCSNCGSSRQRQDQRQRDGD